MKTAILIITIILSSTVFVLAFPPDNGSAKCASCHTLTVEEANKVMSGFAEVKSVRQAPVGALFELVVESKGQQATVYLDYAKKHLVPGPIFNLASKKPIGEPPRPLASPAVKSDAIPIGNSILLGNPKGTKRLFVFTDPECPYCVKLHWELVKLAADEPDLAIYIKMFPLKMHPAAYDKARVILGANSFELLSKAFAGEALPAPGPTDAAKPVDDTILLAASLGINSTPTLVFPDGRILPGFREAAAIRELLIEKKAK